MKTIIISKINLWINLWITLHLSVDNYGYLCISICLNRRVSKGNPYAV
jgi:hypothetical protein